MRTNWWRHSWLAQRVQIESSTVARRLARSSAEGAPWELTAGSVPALIVYHADALVVTVPATPAARLLAPLSADAARELGKIAGASMVILSLALPRRGLPKLPGSGFLVPPVEGRAVKSLTFSTVGWCSVEYAVGHGDRVARIRAAGAQVPGLVVGGAAVGGVGIPACIASGQQAAEEVLTHLRGSWTRTPE